MLKFSICTCAWSFTIFLLVVPVTITEKYNLNYIGCSASNYCSHCHRDQDCEWLTDSNCFLLNFTNVLQDIVSVLLNGTCVSDSISVISRFETINSIETVNDLKKLKKLKSKLKNTRNYDRSVENYSRGARNHYVNDRSVFTNASRKAIKGNKYQENRAEYRWKRRALCAVPDNGNQVTGKLFDHIFSNVRRETGERKTLSDYDRPDLLNNIDNPDSFVPHVRVKRNRLLSDPVSVYQQNYLKDLANSFPRNSYESVDENSYDDDASFDAKREIKSQEYFANDEQLNAFSENDQPKIRSVHPFTAPVSNDENKSDKNALAGDSKSNTFENKNRRSTNKEKYQDNVSLDKPSAGNVAVMNRQSEDAEAEDIPVDPMLAVELVRKKRNNYAKIHNKRRATSDFQIERNERSAEEEKESEAESSEQNFNPSRLSVANLKAKLLRMRRKAKDSRREKKPKLKKKKKHAGKKHNGASNLQIRDVRLRDTDRRAPRERKTTDAKSDGKSEVDIANIVAKKNIDNNFRGRSVKSKKSIEKTEFENDPSPRKTPSRRNANSKLISKNKINVDNSKRSASENDDAGDDNDDDDYPDDELGSDESPNARQSQGTVKQGEISSEETKLREKRNKYTVPNHGFLSKEEELRYYQNIREPGSEIDEFSSQDENQLSAGNNVEPVRAIRSIEEVKELAKKLVSKVNELQNYLNIEEVTGDEKDKKIEVRAIDDLCSNVSNACDAFREAPKIVQKCTSSTHGFEPAKIVERKVNPIGSREHKLVKDASKVMADQKRSLGNRRVVKMSGSSRMKKENGQKWGKWTDWSSCSVTCGKGRQIRWRYCLHDCSTAETEMEEKACQLPACPPKFLGIF